MFSYKYPHPAVSADCIVFAREEDVSYVLLIQRKNEPCKGEWAFPGGFMNIDETADDAARRELNEETGLKIDKVCQVGAYSTVDRDPRERVVTIAYYTEICERKDVFGGDDASLAQWFDLSRLPKLAFDHDEILKDAIVKWNSERK